MEFRRYLTRFFHLILRLTNMKGITLTENIQYESVILPLMSVLEDAGVEFIYNTVVTDMDFPEGDAITVTGLHTLFNGAKGYIQLHEGDMVICTLGCMTDNLWTCSFYPDKQGRFVKKNEYACNGMEILEEILMSLPMDDCTRQKCRDEVVAAIPVILPYTNAHFMPRAIGDRPKVVPENSTNLGFTGQYCEVPEDCVFTEEYSVRAARTAVYTLLDMKREVAPVKPIRYDARIIMGGLMAYLK